MLKEIIPHWRFVPEHLEGRMCPRGELSHQGVGDLSQHLGVPDIPRRLWRA